MRRLPIFLLIDVSESMAGEPIENVQSGIAVLLDALTSDPYAIETVHISVIAFAGAARVLTPLTYILDFQPPKLPIGSGTNLSSALNLLMDEIRNKVKKNSPESKGDWRPLVFLLTDGAPNDNCQNAIMNWKKDFGTKSPLIAVQMGNNSDSSILRQLTDNVLVFKDTNKASYSAFFKWVSVSIQTQSQQVNQDKDAIIEHIQRNIDKDLIVNTPCRNSEIEHAVIVSRCQKTKKPYLMRYLKGGKYYKLEGAFKIEESYFEMSSGDGEKSQINSNLLQGVAACPYCGNVICGIDGNCGKPFCMSNLNLRHLTCPWCGSVGDYGVSEGINLSRGRG